MTRTKLCDRALPNYTLGEELLNAINEVLETLLVKDANGQTEIEKMVMKHMGMES